jgi:hypothetical protein
METTHPLERDRSLSWETEIPLVTNPLIARQLLLVAAGAGLLMAFLLTFIMATTGEFDQIPMMLLISLAAAVGLGLLLFLVALIAFGNRIRVRFTVDAEGILWETVDRRARAGNRLAVIAGMLGGSPQTAGAGLLGASRETETVRWDELAGFSVAPRHRMLTLRGRWRPVMMVVCLPENFDRVTAYANNRIAPPMEGAKLRLRSRPLINGLLRTGLVVLAAAPVFALASYPFNLDLLLPLIWFVFALATVWLIPLFGWVVIACSVLLGLQIAWIGASEFVYLGGTEQITFFLAFAGLALMFALAWRALHGRVLSPLMEP